MVSLQPTELRPAVKLPAGNERKNPSGIIASTHAYSTIDVLGGRLLHDPASTAMCDGGSYFVSPRRIVNQGQEANQIDFASVDFQLVVEKEILDACSSGHHPDEDRLG